MTTFSRICRECTTNIDHCHFNAQFCSKECGKISTQKQISAEIFEKNPNALQCRCCNLYVDKGLIKHLNKLHNISVAKYKTLYGADAQIVSEATSKKLSTNNKGEKNAWFNHAGKLSKFSKKHTSYKSLSEEEKEAAITAFSKARDYDPTTLTNRIEHYLAQGMSEEESKAALSKRQTTFSLEVCIKKYGQEVGLKRWQERQAKWQNTLDSKPEEEIERINQSKIWKSGSCSKISQELFSSITIPGARWGYKSADNKGEMQIKIGDNRRMMLDFVAGNKVIEFHGDYWHANPTVYIDENRLFTRRFGHQTAKEIRDLDAFKSTKIKEHGFQLLIVWESDFRKDKESVIQACKEFLTS